MNVIRYVGLLLLIILFTACTSTAEATISPTVELPTGTSLPTTTSSVTPSPTSTPTPTLTPTSTPTSTSTPKPIKIHPRSVDPRDRVVELGSDLDFGKITNFSVSNSYDYSIHMFSPMGTIDLNWVSTEEPPIISTVGLDPGLYDLTLEITDSENGQTASIELPHIAVVDRNNPPKWDSSLPKWGVNLSDPLPNGFNKTNNLYDEYLNELSQSILTRTGVHLGVYHSNQTAYDQHLQKLSHIILIVHTYSIEDMITLEEIIGKHPNIIAIEAGNEMNSTFIPEWYRDPKYAYELVELVGAVTDLTGLPLLFPSIADNDFDYFLSDDYEYVGEMFDINSAELCKYANYASLHDFASMPPNPSNPTEWSDSIVKIPLIRQQAEKVFLKHCGFTPLIIYTEFGQPMWRLYGYYNNGVFNPGFFTSNPEAGVEYYGKWLYQLWKKAMDPPDGDSPPLAVMFHDNDSYLFGEGGNEYNTETIIYAMKLLMSEE